MIATPLKGINILDFGWVIAGPYGTGLLSDLGARVVKVEAKKNLDLMRTSPNMKRKGVKDFAEEGAWCFQVFNKNKESITLDIKSESGRAIMLELVKHFDVVCGNLAPSTFHKMGLSYENLKTAKEDIIVVNASGFGNDGPYSEYLSYAPIVHALTGLTNTIGYPDLNIRSISSIVDYVGGLAVAESILAAIEYRRQTGRGQFVDISQAETMMGLMGIIYMHFQSNGTIPQLRGNQRAGDAAAPHDVFPCKDEDSWCVISVDSEEAWLELCHLMDPDGLWTRDPEYATFELRLNNLEKLNTLVGEWTQDYTPAELADMLQKAGVSAAPVQNSADLFADPHLESRGFFMPMIFPPSDREPQEVLVPGNPFLMGNTTRSAPRCAPSLGEHTRKIMEEFLGMDDTAFQTAMENGAFGEL